MRPTTFSLIGMVLKEVFPACQLPSLIAILHHQDMPNFIERMSLERDEGAQRQVLTLIQKIISMTLNLFNASKSSHVVLIHPTPLAFFFRSVCALAQTCLDSTIPTCLKMHRVQFLLDILLPPATLLQQRCDVHPHHTMQVRYDTTPFACDVAQRKMSSSSRPPFSSLSYILLHLTNTERYREIER